MKIFPLYQDFFNFLEAVSPHPSEPSEKWQLYMDHYYQPNKDFLDTYFSQSPMIDSSALKERVEAIRPGDYAGLKSLCALFPPEKIIDDAYGKCFNVVAPPEGPECYLFIGFFSPDGFVMTFREKPVIGFGLERYRDFRLLQVIFAHEYVHFLLRLTNPGVPEQKRVSWLLVAEGLGTYFSSLVFPEIPLFDHFFFSRGRLNWCQANEGRLREIYCSEGFSSQELTDFYFKGSPDLDLPPRVAKYLGFQAVRRYLAQNPEATLRSLLLDKNLAFSVEI